jgi:hypothetical protein
MISPIADASICNLCDDAPIHCQDIPSAVLSALYIVETDRPPSTIVLLSFSTSLVYLGCALLVHRCT